MASSPVFTVQSPQLVGYLLMVTLKLNYLTIQPQTYHNDSLVLVYAHLMAFLTSVQVACVACDVLTLRYPITVMSMALCYRNSYNSTCTLKIQKHYMWTSHPVCATES